MANEITSKTTIKELLAGDKDAVIDALVKFNSNFSKLQNPILRNLMARRTSIEDACKIARCPVEEFMEVLRSIGFTIGIEPVVMDEKASPNVQKASNFVELDVRPILAQNGDPLRTILAAINNLQGDQGLKLINTFEPVPLIHLLVIKRFGIVIVVDDK